MDLTYSSPAFVVYFGEVIYPFIYAAAEAVHMDLTGMDQLMKVSFQIVKPVLEIPDVVRDGLNGRIRKPFLQNRVFRLLKANLANFKNLPSAPPQHALRETLKEKFDKAQLAFVVTRKKEI